MPLLVGTTLLSAYTQIALLASASNHPASANSLPVSPPTITGILLRTETTHYVTETYWGASEYESDWYQTAAVDLPESAAFRFTPSFHDRKYGVEHDVSVNDSSIAGAEWLRVRAYDPEDNSPALISLIVISPPGNRAQYFPMLYPTNEPIVIDLPEDGYYVWMLRVQNDEGLEYRISGGLIVDSATGSLAQKGGIVITAVEPSRMNLHLFSDQSLHSAGYWNEGKNDFFSCSVPLDNRRVIKCEGELQSGSMPLLPGRLVVHGSTNHHHWSYNLEVGWWGFTGAYLVGWAPYTGVTVPRDSEHEATYPCFYYGDKPGVAVIENYLRDALIARYEVYVEYRVHYDANGKPDAVRISRISIPNLEVIHPLVELSGEWNGSFSVDYASNFQIGDWRRGILEKDPETGDGRWTADFGGIVEVKVAESPICSILVLY